MKIKLKIKYLLNKYLADLRSTVFEEYHFVFFYFDILSLIKKKNILGFSAFQQVFVCLFVFFRVINYILIARRIRCSPCVSRKGGTPLFGLDGNVPLSRAFTRMRRLDEGESLFKLLASLTYAYHYLMTLIK